MEARAGVGVALSARTLFHKLRFEISSPKNKNCKTNQINKPTTLLSTAPTTSITIPKIARKGELEKKATQKTTPTKNPAIMAPPIKKRKVTAQPVEEISFDPEARQEYLSGFHKRKVARAEHGREMAEKRAKEAAVAARKEVC